MLVFAGGSNLAAASARLCLHFNANAGIKCYEQCTRQEMDRYDGASREARRSPVLNSAPSENEAKLSATGKAIRQKSLGRS